MASSHSLPVCLYNFHIICLYLIYLMASFDKCLFLDRFPVFEGTSLSTVQSISLFKIFKHSVAVLFFRELFQSNFATYFLMSLYHSLWNCFLYRIFYSALLLLNDNIYLVVIITPQWLTYLDIIFKCPFMRSITHSLPWLVLAHVEKVIILY